MNQSQINQVKGHLEEFTSIDLADLIANSLGESPDLMSINIGEYTAKEYFSVVNKVFRQLSEEIDSSYAKTLPFQYNFHNEYGSGNLHQDLANLLNQIKTNNFRASIPQLNKLAHYQAVNGFWEKSKRKYFRSSESNVKDDQERINLVTKHMLKVSERLTRLIEEINEEKEGVNLFLKSKNSELSEIEALLNASRQHSNEINDLYTKSSTVEERITSTLENSEDKKNDIETIESESRKLLMELKSLLKDNNENTKSNNETYSKLVRAFEEKLSYVEEKKEYFEERNSYLDDLIEREVGASLFETFKQRKKELITSIGFWKWTVPITAVATIAWIFFLFGNGDLSDLAWQVIVVNSLKALPAIGILLFAISQYVKERNFQEEYAFKSAVALTINSYADQLNETTNKDKMIMDSVTQIYKSPIHQKTAIKDQNAITASAKELVETAKSIVPQK
ncbi:hypothetical protein L0668_01970 [Paraglaciecola aquimarina]|uniref:Uncharacterized protein n=1 Tax=Paraglaciecola algarum TaxID=3050085 RepID=A0ABS9D1U0_9ALTE|nr:hypothetical protein [Paraglaciecola sp. G1-23]MCF2946857.1 hypothetical protein [Paraglaciecola sp. G1-23]